MVKDSYNSISKATEGDYRDRGSKFLAYLYPVDSVAAVSINLDALKRLHPKSRHVCYSYIIGIEQNEYRINDDGEPSGSAGLPIYNALRSQEVSDVLLAVIRYFGGTKLGIPGLIKAYKGSSLDALHKSTKITKFLTERITMLVSMDKVGILYDVLHANDATIISTNYTDKVELTLDVRLSQIESLQRKVIAHLHNIRLSDLPRDFESNLVKFNELDQS